MTLQVDAMFVVGGGGVEELDAKIQCTGCLELFFKRIYFWIFSPPTQVFPPKNQVDIPFFLGHARMFSHSANGP